MTKISDLNRDELWKLSLLSAAREEHQEDTLIRFGKASLSKSPRNFSKKLPQVRSLEIVETGVEGHLAWLKLASGEFFWGHKSHAKLQREYEWLFDRLPASITAENYLLAIDVAGRYLTPYAWPPSHILPELGGTVVEVGAYLGHKSIRFVNDCVGTSGTVVAIEMMPENIEIMALNVESNQLTDCIKVVPKGVWDKNTELPIFCKGRQRNSLVHINSNLEKIDAKVEVESLEQIIRDLKLKFVDLLYISANGAELEVIRGLGSKLSSVGAIFIVSPYVAEDGVRYEERCRQALTDLGLVVEPSTVKNQICARNPQHNAMG